jgi:6-phosphofructokinase 1
MFESTMGTAKIAFLTGGGNSPGMGAAAAGFVRRAGQLGFAPYFVMGGARGLSEGAVVQAPDGDLSEWIGAPGSPLGCGPRCSRLRDPDTRARVIAALDARGLRGLVLAGGNGSMALAHDLALDAQRIGSPLRVVGTSATIDGDLAGTTLGFWSAVEAGVEALGRLRVTAAAHRRVFAVEVMGGALRPCCRRRSRGCLAPRGWWFLKAFLGITRDSRLAWRRSRSDSTRLSGPRAPR